MAIILSDRGYKELVDLNTDVVRAIEDYREARTTDTGRIAAEREADRMAWKMCWGVDRILQTEIYYEPEGQNGLRQVK